jgi:hypothetical protein
MKGDEGGSSFQDEPVSCSCCDWDSTGDGYTHNTGGRQLPLSGRSYRAEEGLIGIVWGGVVVAVKIGRRTPNVGKVIKR